jgi:acyl-CoA thioester hydrolase
MGTASHKIGASIYGTALDRAKYRGYPKVNRQKIFSLDIDVRFRDLDALGHVNHAVFFTYFEVGRTILFRNVFGDRKFRFIMAHACCDYFKPATMNDQLRLWMRVGKIGNKSFELQYELIDRRSDENRFAKGETIQVCYDYEENRSIPVPEDMRKRLAEYQWGIEIVER